MNVYLKVHHFYKEVKRILFSIGKTSSFYLKAHFLIYTSWVILWESEKVKSVIKWLFIGDY